MENRYLSVTIIQHTTKWQPTTESQNNLGYIYFKYIATLLPIHLKICLTVYM